MAYSIQRAVSDGTLSTIPLDIEFFAKEHIKVYVDELVLPNSTYTYQWIGPETIKITPNVAVGKEVLLKRTTPYDKPFHNFKLGAVFKDETMDENFLQTMFITQEAVEGQTSTDFYADLNFHGYRLTNIGNATNATDAVPLVQYQADANGAYQSRVVAEAARVASLASQNAAAASASAASTSAQSASTSMTAAAASAQAAKASENIVVPLAPQVQQAAADAAAASAQAAQASADAKQAVTDVKQLGAVPLGTIILWGLTSAIPAGYLKLDGSTFSKTDYPDLAKLIPSGVLPDWRDRYVKMAGSEAVGSTAGGSIPSHTHTGKTNTTGAHNHSIANAVNGQAGGAGIDSGSSYNRGYDTTGTGGDHQHTFTTDPAGTGTKVEVDRVVAVYIIKAAGKVSDEGLAQVVGLRTDVTALQSNLTTVTSRVTTLEGKSAKSSGSISTATTAVDIPIPAGVDEFHLALMNTAWSAASNPALILNGESGGYVGTVNVLGTTYTDFGHLHTPNYIPLFHTNAVAGQFFVNLRGVRNGNSWVITGTGSYNGVTQVYVAGSKTLAAELSTLRVYGTTFTALNWVINFQKY